MRSSARRHGLVRLAGAGGLLAALVGCGPTGLVSAMSGPVETHANPVETQVQRMAVSPRLDGWATVEWSGGEQAALVLHGLAGATHKLADVPYPVETLDWSGDGTTVVYSQHLTRIIPGEFSDWDVPARESLGYRLMAVPVEGGEPRLLVESPMRLMPVQAPPGPVVAYFNGGDVEYAYARREAITPAQLHVRDLDGSHDETLGDADTYSSQVAWSPAGDRVALRPARVAGREASLVVVDRQSGERRVVATQDVEQYFWTAQGFTYLLKNDWRVMWRDALDGTAPVEVAVPMPIYPRSRTDGWYMASPDGDKLLAMEGLTTDIRFIVYSLSARRSITLDAAAVTNRMLQWQDDDHLVAFPNAGAATTIPVTIAPLACEPPAAIGFDLPTRDIGAQNPEWAQTVEAPYLGGPFRFAIGLPGLPGQYHGVMSFQAVRSGLHSVMLSKDVPVRVLKGSLYGTTTAGAPQPLSRVAADGYVRYDVTLPEGPYTLELGPTPERDVTVAIPQAPQPACIEKGVPFD